jgi:hypothetical protein
VLLGALRWQFTALSGRIEAGFARLDARLAGLEQRLPPR